MRATETAASGRAARVRAPFQPIRRAARRESGRTAAPADRGPAHWPGSLPSRRRRIQTTASARQIGRRFRDADADRHSRPFPRRWWRAVQFRRRDEKWPSGPPFAWIRRSAELWRWPQVLVKRALQQFEFDIEIAEIGPLHARRV